MLILISEKHPSCILGISITFRFIKFLPAIFAIENQFMLKQIFLFLLMLMGSTVMFAQVDTMPLANDSINRVGLDSLRSPISDSIKAIDSSLLVKNDSIIPTQIRLQKLLDEHLYLNTKGKPVAVPIKIRKVQQLDVLFYLIVGLLFLFGILRAVYNRYFSTLFTVFFNSSLRQSQLTDQLIQAKLPSLLFNILFLLAGSCYVYLLIQHPASAGYAINWVLLGTCLVAMLGVYLVKFITLKFIGWSTGFRQESNLYIFVVFLINKVIGIFLLPILVIVSFSSNLVVAIFTILSFVLLGLLFLLRYFRAYGLLQHRIKVSRFHFLMYVFAIEILPLLLIYKAVNVFILKNL